MREKNTFTIFGGTGDLTFRKLLPALYNMEMTGSNPFDTQIVIIGRRDYTSTAYRELARDWVEKFARLHFREDVYQRMADRIVYYRMDFTKEEAYGELNDFYHEINAGNHIFYFAVAPRFFPVIVQGLKKVEGAQGGKVVLEKPFGESLEAAECDK